MRSQYMRCLFFVASSVLMFALAGSATAAEHGDIGVVVLHGKWDSPDGHASGLANYLQREGFRTSTPEMPWAGRRAYDKNADAMVADIGKAANELRAAGAKKIYVAGHSQGAVGALYYAGQQQVDGIVLIAAGGHAQSKSFVANYSSFVTKAKSMVEHGKGSDSLSFDDLNTGGRRRIVRAPAQSVLDYFDPEGPFNSELAAAHVKPGTRVLIVIPQREVEPLKNMARRISVRLPEGAKARIVDVDADHLNAPDATKSVVRDWLLGS